MDLTPWFDCLDWRLKAFLFGAQFVFPTGLTFSEESANHLAKFAALLTLSIASL